MNRRSALLLSPGSPPLASPHCSAPWPTREERNEDLTGHFEKLVIADQDKKVSARRRGEQLATHKLNPWALNFSLCLFFLFIKHPDGMCSLREQY